jgi:hypothetical protein
VSNGVSTFVRNLAIYVSTMFVSHVGYVAVFSGINQGGLDPFTSKQQQRKRSNLAERCIPRRGMVN